VAEELARRDAERVDRKREDGASTGVLQGFVLGIKMTSISTQT